MTEATTFDERFIADLAELARLRGLGDSRARGILAKLRRGVGKEPGTDSDAYPFVVPRLPQRERQHRDYYTVAALLALHPMNTQPPEGPKTRHNMGTTMRLAAIAAHGVGEIEGSSTERRFVAMLDSHRDELEDHLRHAIRLARSREVPVNYLQLLKDLGRWNLEGRRVQRAWAAQFWGRHTTDNVTETDAAHNAAVGD